MAWRLNFPPDALIIILLKYVIVMYTVMTTPMAESLLCDLLYTISARDTFFALFLASNPLHEFFQVHIFYNLLFNIYMYTVQYIFVIIKYSIRYRTMQ